MMNRQPHISNISRQSGVALILGLVMLLVLTLLSMSSMTMSSMELRIASNVQNQNHCFQGAEQGIMLDLSLLDISQTWNSIGHQLILSGVFETVLGTDYNDEIYAAPLPNDVLLVNGWLSATITAISSWLKGIKLTSGLSSALAITATSILKSSRL